MKRAPGKIPRALFYHNYYAVLSDHGNDLLRTFRRAGATSGTFLLIDVCHIVQYMDRVELALLLAELASDRKSVV